MAKKLQSGILDVQKFVEKSLITDPKTQLKPGDILVYGSSANEPGGLPPAEPDGGGLPEGAGGPPGGYETALDGFHHAAIVAKDETGKLYHLDAPFNPENKGRDREFQGGAPYFVLRPKTPKGMTRDEFEKKVSAVANAFRAAQFDYDSLMRTDYLNPGTQKRLRDAVESSCPLKKGDVPAVYCSGLTQLVVGVAGGATAKGTTFSKMIDKALDKLKEGEDGKKLEGKALEKAVEKAVDETIEYFMPGRNLPMLEREREGLEKELKETTDAKQKEALQKYLDSVKEQIKEASRNRWQWELSRTLLKQALLQKVRGEKGVLPALMDTVTSSKIIRPVDILNEAKDKDGAFTFAGYYPGNLPPCVDRTPRARRGEPEVLPPPREEKEPELDH